MSAPGSFSLKPTVHAKIAVKSQPYEFCFPLTTCFMLLFVAWLLVLFWTTLYEVEKERENGNVFKEVEEELCGPTDHVVFIKALVLHWLYSQPLLVLPPTVRCGEVLKTLVDAKIAVLLHRVLYKMTLSLCIHRTILCLQPGFNRSHRSTREMKCSPSF